MHLGPVITQIDHALKLVGFARQKRLWNRRFQSIIDVLDVQVSKSHASVTINVGLVDVEVYAIFWGKGPPEFVEQPFCTVCLRVGELIDGRDKWWDIDRPTFPGDVVESVAKYVLPCFDRLHSRSAMKKWLIDSGVIRKGYPPPIINLAILDNLLGDPKQGCARLAEFQKESPGAWEGRVTEIAKRLGCV
jgi:hypothetical protein